MEVSSPFPLRLIKSLKSIRRYLNKYFRTKYLIPSFFNITSTLVSKVHYPPLIPAVLMRRFFFIFIFPFILFSSGFIFGANSDQLEDKNKTKVDSPVKNQEKKKKRILQIPFGLKSNLSRFSLHLMVSWKILKLVHYPSALTTGVNSVC